MMPILACLISFLLACCLVNLLGEQPLNDGAGLRPVPITSGPLARTPERPTVASFSVRRPAACK
jgi:hypothetical protein